MSKPSTHQRYQDLKQILEGRRREVLHQIKKDMARMQARDGDRHTLGVGDAGDSAEASIQGEIDTELVQMRNRTVIQIDGALALLEKGNFGDCAECGEPISVRRLNAVPFAVHCTDCAKNREASDRSKDNTRRQRRGARLFR